MYPNWLQIKIKKYKTWIFNSFKNIKNMNQQATTLIKQSETNSNALLDRTFVVQDYVNKLKMYRQNLMAKLGKTDRQLLRYIQEYQELFRMRYEIEFQAISDDWEKANGPIGDVMDAAEFLSAVDAIWEN